MSRVVVFGPFTHVLDAGGLEKGQIHGTWYPLGSEFRDPVVVATAYAEGAQDTYVKVREVLVKKSAQRVGDLVTYDTHIGVNVENAGDAPIESYVLSFQVTSR